MPGGFPANLPLLSFAAERQKWDANVHPDSRACGGSHRYGLQMCGKVAQEWGFVGQVHAGDLLAVLPDFENDLDYIVDVALGIDAAGDRQADQVHLCCAREHQRADFYGTDSTFQIQFCGESYAGKLIWLNVRKEGTGVKIDSVTSRRLDDGDSVARDVIAEVGGGGDAV